MTPSGFLAIDKPPGLTSHDVVARIRSAIRRAAKVGHLGTLDPLATGLLILCIGDGTRLAEWASSDSKEYLCEVTLGIATDSYDRNGTVTETRPVTSSFEEIKRALATMIGTFEQRPPTFSAIKVAGQRAYRSARRGDPLELAPREVHIASLDIESFATPVLALRVACSKGTYVRSIAHDLGEVLSCGAHVSALRRTRSGDFGLSEAVTLEAAVAALRDQDYSMLIPTERVARRWPRLELEPGACEAVRHGKPLGGVPETEGSETVAGWDRDGRLVAILAWRDSQWWPRKVFGIN